VRGGARRETLARLLTRPRYELIPLAGAEEKAAAIPAGSTVTVTSSPRRGMNPTLALVEHLAGMGFRTVPHLSARLIEGPDQLDEIAWRMQAMGVQEVFVVGGDSTEPAGPFASALSFLQAMHERGHRFERIGIAGYPEPHPKIDEVELLRALLDKQPFAQYIVTQMCYSAGTISAWIDRIRREGVTLPIHVGVPGAVARAKLLEISLRCGVGDSVRYLRKNAGFVARLLGGGGRTFRAGAFVAELARLLDSNDEAQPLHLNTFNQIEGTEQWRLDVIRALLGESMPVDPAAEQVR
jgi:methylenetetrahydrofolate reductase (NADPH)